jgi:hypothetical protein
MRRIHRHTTVRLPQRQKYNRPRYPLPISTSKPHTVLAVLKKLTAVESSKPIGHHHRQALKAGDILGNGGIKTHRNILMLALSPTSSASTAISHRLQDRQCFKTDGCFFAKAFDKIVAGSMGTTAILAFSECMVPVTTSPTVPSPSAGVKGNRVIFCITRSQLKRVTGITGQLDGSVKL